MEFKPVATRASQLSNKQNESKEFQAIVFAKPNAFTKQTPKENQDTDRFVKKSLQNLSLPKPSDDLEFNIKNARHEVLRFAMNNHRVSKSKKKMEIFQAIKLGAKPAKKSYKNYKDLLEERKRLKQIRDERQRFHQIGKNQTGAANQKCRSKSKIKSQQKKRAPVTAIDQHYGKV